MEYDPKTDIGKLTIEEMTKTSSQPKRQFNAREAIALAFGALDTHQILDAMIQDYSSSQEPVMQGMLPDLRNQSLEALQLSQRLATIGRMTEMPVVTDLDCEELRIRRFGPDDF